jgi:Restriction endonuclease
MAFAPTFMQTLFWHAGTERACAHKNPPRGWIEGVRGAGKGLALGAAVAAPYHFVQCRQSTIGRKAAPCLTPSFRHGTKGVDVIARKDGISVAIQCKRYSNPVGNKAVQEVFAGKGYVGADIGVVVSNTTFTPQAKELASNLGVLLLHHDELPELQRRIPHPAK